jgi:F-type H+-transporting ATPase subunit b
MTSTWLERFVVAAKKCAPILAVLCISFFTAASAHAAEEAANPAAARATEIFKWINFAIVGVAIYWFFAVNRRPWFRGNADSISSAITKATAAKNEADRQLREAETKLANLQKEVEELRAIAANESAAEVERIRKATQLEAQKVSVAAKLEIEAAERAARLELKALAAKLAVDGAESLLAKQLTPQAQESLVSAFVKSLDGRPN